MKKYLSIMVIGLTLSLCFSVTTVSSNSTNNNSAVTTFYFDICYKNMVYGYKC